MSKKLFVKAVVLDWAGTTVDYGCRAPLKVFLDIFANIGVPISVEEASKPMGMLKIEHIKVLLGYERIREAFTAKFGKAPTQADVQRLYDDFEPQLYKLLPEYSDPLPHVVESVERLRQNGIKIGSTSGYIKPMLDVVAPIAAAKGYKPDFAISSSEVPAGRPAPFMMYQNAIKV